jgi:hypothetical protein
MQAIGRWRFEISNHNSSIVRRRKNTLLASIFVLFSFTICAAIVLYLQIEEVRTGSLASHPSDYVNGSFSMAIQDAFWLRPRPALRIRLVQISVDESYMLVINMRVTNSGPNMVRFNCVFFDVGLNGWRTQDPEPGDESLFMLELMPLESRTGRMTFSPFDQMLSSGKLECIWRDSRGIPLDAVEISLQSQ